MEDDCTVHLILDGKCTNVQILSESRVLADLMKELVELIDMKPISEPFIVEYPDGNGQERGLSACLFLAESSVLIHTYPEYKFAFIDVFSCKDFNDSKTRLMLTERLGMEVRNDWLLERGMGSMKIGGLS